MSILIEDSPRNLLAWVAEALRDVNCRGAVLSPFATPLNARTGPGGRRGAPGVASEITSAGAELWFDPTTHALQMAGVGDYRYYDEYQLWGGARGDLSTPALQEEHVRRVFEAQDRLGARRLAPTVLLHHGESATSQLALDLARRAVDLDPECSLSIAGTPPFWASGSALDAHVGALAQLEPSAWLVCVVRPALSLPVEADPAEVFGACRTVRALGEYAPVHVSHGDLAALPAVAAGATSVGTGWDQRQRVCAYPSYSTRDPNGSGGGGWYERPTYRGLLGSLRVNESELLVNRDPVRAARLGPPPPPGPREAFLHNASVLGSLVAQLLAEPRLDARYRQLMNLYDAASAEWPPVVALTRSSIGEREWVAALAEGLRRYGAAEGW